MLTASLRTELVGYKYYCTSACVGRAPDSHSSVSTALSHVGSGTYVQLKNPPLSDTNTNSSLEWR